MTTFTDLYMTSRIKQSWIPMFEEFENKCNNDNKYKKSYHGISSILEAQLNGTSTIYPARDNILKAFEFFEVPECKVIILGQDPYHQPRQAMGLSFSVSRDCTIPPSLKNIFTELVNDNNCPRSTMPSHGDLTEWAEQGVLLLNCSLTVEDSKPNIHSKEWTRFTDFVISWLSENCNQQLVFMLWGTYAKNKNKLIKNTDKHIIYQSNHPSPLSANKGGWFGCQHFGKTAHLINW